MPPIPCAHCGHNFMRPTNDPEAPKLCHNCSIREDKRTNKGENKMSNVDILITCPRDLQIEIEEHCINQGVDFTKYFLGLHRENMQLKEDLKKGPDWKDILVNPKPEGKPDFVVNKKDLDKKIKGGKK